MDKEHNRIKIEGREVENSELFRCSRRMRGQKHLGSCKGVSKYGRDDVIIDEGKKRKLREPAVIVGKVQCKLSLSMSCMKYTYVSLGLEIQK